MRALAIAAVVVVLWLTLTACAPAPKSALGPPHFVDETATSGIDHVYDGDASFAVGGGVAVFDCNGDGKPDLFIGGGSRPAALYRNDSEMGGALKFSRLTDPATDLTGVNGAYPIDLFGAGMVDLVLLRNRETVILRGLGDCRFERANEALGFNGAANALTTAFSATWEGSNRLPTLALGHYLQLDASGSQSESESESEKTTFDCADNA